MVKRKDLYAQSNFTPCPSGDRIREVRNGKAPDDEGVRRD